MPSKELLLAPPPKMKTRVGQALAHLVSGPGVEDTSFLGKKNWLHKMMALVISSTMMLAGWDHLGQKN